VIVEVIVKVIVKVRVKVIVGVKVAVRLIVMGRLSVLCVGMRITISRMGRWVGISGMMLRPMGIKWSLLGVELFSEDSLLC